MSVNRVNKTMKNIVILLLLFLITSCSGIYVTGYDTEHKIPYYQTIRPVYYPIYRPINYPIYRPINYPVRYVSSHRI